MLTFVTPYWSGPEMMRLHLESIRRFHPGAPILISKRGGGAGEMKTYEREFGARYWIDNVGYFDALMRLLRRVETEYVCVTDHDVALLSPLDPLLEGIVDGRWDLVGVEERITDPYATGWPWMRYAPGYMDATLLVFNLHRFRERWGVSGIRFEAGSQTCSVEYHYGLCNKLPRHKYLRPYHTAKYGFGNLLRDGETNVAWHQWFGSYRHRPLLSPEDDFSVPVDRRIETLRNAEQAFLTDYPNLDFSSLKPAWGEGLSGVPLRFQPWPWHQRLANRAVRFGKRYIDWVRG